MGMLPKRPVEEELALDSDTLLKKLRVLDPEISPLDYWVAEPDAHERAGERGADGQGGRWDHEALAEDLWLTSRYVTNGLESALQPLRSDMQKVLAPAATCLSSSPRDATEIVPGRLFLGNAAAARNLELLRNLGIRRVLNASPQTVRTSLDAYGHMLSGLISAYHEVWADDLLDYCIMDHFNEAWNFFAPSGGDAGACLLHCEQGVNRSGALACAIHMRWSQQEREARSARVAGQCGRIPPTPRPEEMFWASWKVICEQRGDGRGVVTNPGFQRQLLLFARLGCQWWHDLPSVSTLWRTPRERSMAVFRDFVERVAWRVVREWPAPGIEEGCHRFLATLVRDGAMRFESKLPPESGFNLDASTGGPERAERRVSMYAQKLVDRKVKALGLGQAAAAPRD